MGEVFELEAQWLGGLDARDHDVAGAVDQLVLAEVGGRGRQHVHTAVVDADGFVGGGVVVLDHALTADDDHLTQLARREPGDLHVGGLPLREGERHEGGLGHALAQHAGAGGGDFDDGLLEPVEEDREIVRR